MTEGKENFDAEVVVGMDKAIDFACQDPAMIMSKEQDTPTLIWAPLVAMSLSSLWKLHDEETEEGLTGFDVKAAMARLSRLRQKDRKLFEIICEGRLKIAFLIDCDGGDAFLMDMFRDSVDEVARRGGKSYAYVQNAQSSAMDVMMTTDVPLVKDDSMLMWHHATDTDSGRVILDKDEVLADIEDLMLFLNRGKGFKKDQLVRRAKIALADPSNIRSTVFFSGEELKDAGCAKQSFEDLDEMRQHFAENFRSCSFEPVEDFWEEKGAGDGHIVFNQPSGRIKTWPRLRRIK